MDGVHDLGGMQGFGAVEVEAGEPVFHARWEGRMFAMVAMLSLGGLANTSTFRHAIERMDPADYLRTSYYEHWLAAACALVVEKQVVPGEEVAVRLPGGAPTVRPDSAAPPPPAEPGGDGTRFSPGDRVRVRELHRRGHTRCPRYVRGHEGVVERLDVTCPLPDVEAHGDDPPSEATYCVRFDARELWGQEAEPSSVRVDLWQSYLEAVR